MINQIRYCQNCIKKARCNFYKENSFCEIDRLTLEYIYGFKIAKIKEFEIFTNMQRSETKNNSVYFARLSKEISNILNDLKEIKKEDEEYARFQETKSLAIK